MIDPNTAMYRQSPIFLMWYKESLLSSTTNMATFVVLRHPVTISVTAITSPDKLTNDLLILNIVMKYVVNVLGKINVNVTTFMFLCLVI